MRYAVAYSGFLGNIQRTLNSIKKNITFDPKDEVDVFIVTNCVEKNVIKCMNKTTKVVCYKYGPVYSHKDLYSISPFPIVSITEYSKDPDILKRYISEEKKFIDRTRGYESHTNGVVNYDTRKKVICTSAIRPVFEQYFMLSICLEKIMEHEKKMNIKYDYIIRTRDRQTIRRKIEKCSYVDKGLSLLGYGFNPLYIPESFFIGSRIAVLKAFLYFPKFIGKYRIDTSKFKEEECDTTFSAETQTALHVNYIIGPPDSPGGVNLLMLNHYVRELNPHDGYGPPVIDDDCIDTDLQIDIEI